MTVTLQIWIAMEFCAAGSLSDMMSVCKTTLSEVQVQAAMKMALTGLVTLFQHTCNTLVTLL
jgi:serine/threonine protein kinase